MPSGDEKYELLLWLGKLDNSLDQTKAYRYTKEGIALAVREKRPVQKALFLNNMAYLYLFELKEDTALTVINEALKIDSSLHCASLKATLCITRSRILGSLPNFEAAMEDALTALTVSRDSNLHELECRAMLSVAGIDMLTYRDALAEEQARQCLALSRKYGLPEQANRAAALIGKMCLLTQKSEDEKDRLNEALQWVGEAYNTAHAQGDVITLIENALVYGDIYCSLNRWTKVINPYYQKMAKGYLDEAATLAQEAQIPLYEMSSYCYLARWCRVEKDYKQAILYWKQAIAYAGPAHYQILTQAYDQLVSLYAAVGSIDNMLLSHDSYVLNMGRQSGYQLNMSLQEMETKYKIQDKERIISQQEKDLRIKRFFQILLFIAIAVCLVVIFVVIRYLVLTRRLNRRMKEMDVLKNKIFSLISHDLKNNAIAQRNALQAISDSIMQTGDAALAHQCMMLLQSWDGQIDLLYNLFHWARIEQNDIPVHPAVIDLFSTAKETGELMNTYFDNKHLTFDNKIPPMTTVWADGTILGAVLRNLLSNAVKYSYRGGLITLSSHEVDNRVEVTVEDRGTGISKERFSELFRITDRQSQRGTEGETGTGLGLRICREFIKRMGGSIRLESEEGKGTRAIFSLPKQKNVKS